MTAILDFLNTLLLTFRTVSVLTQVLLILVLPASGLGFYALRIWSRNSKKAEADERGDMIFSSHRNPDGTITTYHYRNGTVKPVKTPPLVNEHVKETTTLRLVKFMEERNEEIEAEKMQTKDSVD
jgi:hypothetical protein